MIFHLLENYLFDFLSSPFLYYTTALPTVLAECDVVTCYAHASAG